ncbi:hypothetical protein QJS04_geneDACA020192 [Acorus gramineus]|uniref:Uncharacterized protein n=1 Tax=Acorus gramineus TaxID=55184 RepID=A0AAV9BPK5_ACOGR|nr:hypothetical protein QJS04_geneDACA020192 [Acorus gramineus]
MEHNIHGGHVRVTNLSKVSPLSTPQNLSFFDQFLVLAPPIRTLQLFSTVGLPFPTIVATLREGLSKALQHFPPLSGKLARCAHGFEIRFDCPDEGVVFIEAECDAEFERVVGEGEAYVRAEELVPRINVRDVPMEALAVQVTRVGEDGVAVGVAMHHVMGDGRAYWSFVKAWAVSSFEAVCAHAWVCATRARRVPARASTVFNFTVDCRSLLDPALPETYFGNALKPCFVEAEACELLRDDGFARACVALHGRVREAMEGDPISDWRSWPDWAEKLGDALLVGMHVVSSPKFRSYDMDFGWGRPRWIEFVPLVPDVAGTMVVADARDDEGGFQVTMVLAQAHMDEFSVLFMGGA